MVPMGDFQNHHDTLANSYEVVNPLMHLRPDKLDKELENNTYFSQEKFMNNYEPVFTKDETECYESDVKGHRFNKVAYENNEAKRTLTYWNGLIEQEDNDLWELNYQEGNISEDNESITDDDSGDEFADYGEEE
jgi:hypothetical protein